MTFPSPLCLAASLGSLSNKGESLRPPRPKLNAGNLSSLLNLSTAAMARREGGGVQDAALLILVIEDDLLIQDMVREALDDGGFQTEITASGEEAIALLHEGDAKYRALLTDINLK